MRMMENMMTFILYYIYILLYKKKNKETNDKRKKKSERERERERERMSDNFPNVKVCGPHKEVRYIKISPPQVGMVGGIV